jgi:coenzyme F420 hydrogenase subunit beta
MDEHLAQLRDVVQGGYCVGCGACAFASGRQMRTNDYGEYVPDLEKVTALKYSSEQIASLCPSLRPDLNEDVIAKQLFAKEAHYDSKLGFVQTSYASYVKEGAFREHGTSGGMGTWIATELLKKGLVDGVIHVKQSKRDAAADPFFLYGISRTAEEIQQASKSRYHVVEVSKVLGLVRENPGRYVFIGVPCISKSIRRLQLVDPLFAERIPFIASLVCGHLKSINWSLALAWSVGINPDDATAIQYRTKEEGIPARAYVFRAAGKNNAIRQQDSSNVPGGKFNAGAMMLPACDFCDDVVGETADVTIGDAWIPRFEVDANGTNLLVVRNTIIHDLLKSAADSDRIMLEEISDAEAANSQSGGFRQRREGLSHRLQRELAKGRWVPRKRVSPGQFALNAARKRIYDGRSEITLKSRQLFREALRVKDFELYTSGIRPLLRKVRIMELRSSFFALAFNKIKRIFFRSLNPHRTR